MTDHRRSRPTETGAPELAAAIASLASSAAAFSLQAQRVAELIAAGTGTSKGALALLRQPEAVMASNAMKLTLTASETADLLGVHARTLQRLRAEGVGPKPITIGTAVRYRRRDVERWLEGKRT